MAWLYGKGKGKVMDNILFTFLFCTWRVYMYVYEICIDPICCTFIILKPTNKECEITLSCIDLYIDSVLKHSSNLIKSIISFANVEL